MGDGCVGEECVCEGGGGEGLGGGEGMFGCRGCVERDVWVMGV